MAFFFFLTSNISSDNEFSLSLKATMKKGIRLLLWMGICWMALSFLGCGEGRLADASREADSLNHRAYEVRYKDWHESEELARRAMELGEDDSSVKAEALNHLAF